MVNPQLENGYTKIADEIMDALCAFRIPGSTRQVIDCIIRKTYGWNKKEDWISHSQIVEMTGMNKGNVSRELSKAITNKIVIVSDNKLRLNKNYHEWIKFGGQHFNPKKKLSDTITKTEENPPASEVIVSDAPVIASDEKVIVSEGNNKHLTKDTIQNTFMAEPTNSPLKDMMSKKQEELKQEQPKGNGITYAWQDKALRYAKDLKIMLPTHARARWMKIFKEASTNERGKASNLEKAYSFIIDYPKAMSNEQKMMFFFKIYERGLEWMKENKV